MSSTGSVSRWLEPLQQGDEAAVERLWERYFVTLVKLARGLLGHKAARAVDGEDVALSAFDSFCRHAAQGHFPRLADRDDLWRLLAVITVRKALRTRRDEGRLKRGGGERLNAERSTMRPCCGRRAARSLRRNWRLNLPRNTRGCCSSWTTSSSVKWRCCAWKTTRSRRSRPRSAAPALGEAKAAVDSQSLGKRKTELTKCPHEQPRTDGVLARPAARAGAPGGRRLQPLRSGLAARPSATS